MKIDLIKTSAGIAVWSHWDKAHSVHFFTVPLHTPEEVIRLCLDAYHEGQAVILGRQRDRVEYQFIFVEI